MHNVTTIAKFTPAITTYGGPWFSNEVGICYCCQIRYLIVNGVFKWTILPVRNFRMDNNSGTSHMMSVFLLKKCFVLGET